jgi:hypothetical protein
MLPVAIPVHLHKHQSLKNNSQRADIQKVGVHGFVQQDGASSLRAKRLYQ